MEVVGKEGEPEGPGGGCGKPSTPGWSAGLGCSCPATEEGLGVEVGHPRRLPRCWDSRPGSPRASSSAAVGPVVRGEGPAVKLNPDVRQRETLQHFPPPCLELESPSSSPGSRVSPLSFAPPVPCKGAADVVQGRDKDRDSLGTLWAALRSLGKAASLPGLMGRGAASSPR